MRLNLSKRPTTLDIHSWHSLAHWHSPFYPVLTMSHHLNHIPLASGRFQRLEDVRVDAEGSFRPVSRPFFEQISWTKKLLEIHRWCRKSTTSSGDFVRISIAVDAILTITTLHDAWAWELNSFHASLDETSFKQQLHLVNRSPNPAIRVRCNKADGRFFWWNHSGDQTRTKSLWSNEGLEKTSLPLKWSSWLVNLPPS